MKIDYPKEPEVKYPHELEVGDCFSYPGSFKVYKVQTKPEVEQRHEARRCEGCGQDRLDELKVRFLATDGALRDRMGIRLDAMTLCTIHESLPLPSLAKQLETIATLGHFEKWVGPIPGWRFFFTDEMKPPIEGAHQGETIEETVRLAYQAYQRNFGLTR